MGAELITGTPDLLAVLQDGILTLTMNRPAARNALNREMILAMAQQLASAELNPAVKCVVLTGAGKAFCSGGDLKGDTASEDGAPVVNIDERTSSQRYFQREISGRLHAMAKPTLAVLPGAAAGAGMALALACDLRILAEPAFFTTAFVNVGFSGDFGGTYFLSQLVGPAKAKELYFLSDRVTSAQALQLGLANWVCEAEELEHKSAETARRLATGPSVALSYMKENLNRALHASLTECLDLEATHHIRCGQTEDHREAVGAFIEKRKPVFRGR